MSHPHTVPEGWTKGQPLIQIGGEGPRFALRQCITSQVAFDTIMAHPLANEIIFAITFDNEADLKNFLAWWYA